MSATGSGWTEVDAICSADENGNPVITVPVSSFDHSAVSPHHPARLPQFLPVAMSTNRHATTHLQDEQHAGITPSASELTATSSAAAGVSFAIHKRKRPSHVRLSAASPFDDAEDAPSPNGVVHPALLAAFNSPVAALPAVVGHLASQYDSDGDSHDEVQPSLVRARLAAPADALTRTTLPITPAAATPTASFPQNLVSVPKNTIVSSFSAVGEPVAAPPPQPPFGPAHPPSQAPAKRLSAASATTASVGSCAFQSHAMVVCVAQTPPLTDFRASVFGESNRSKCTRRDSLSHQRAGRLTGAERPRALRCFVPPVSHCEMHARTHTTHTHTHTRHSALSMFPSR